MLTVYDKRHKKLYHPTPEEGPIIEQVVEVIRTNPDSFAAWTVEMADTVHGLILHSHGWTHAQAVYMANIIRKAGVGELDIPNSDPGEVMTELFSGIQLPKKTSKIVEFKRSN